MRFAVAGGTGVVGRYVVEEAARAGHEAVALSRSTGMDLTSGVGLQHALEGVDVIVDATNGSVFNRKKAAQFFTTVTGHLHRAGAAAGVSRLITISIVNIDKVSGYPYYQAKLAHEEAAFNGPIPATVVRATQFHEFPAQIMQRTKAGPVAMVPNMVVQTVAARAVGRAVVAAAAAEQLEHKTIDVAGPEKAELVDLAKKIVKRLGRQVTVLSVPVPGRSGRAMRSGALTPGPGARIVGPTFEEWLAGDDIDAVA
jgi:uncharacterized protein YbjT (DUF2867 family)